MDRALREAEHRWLQTQSHEDEVLLFRQRLRVCEASRKRVELAFLLGRPAASEALGILPPYDVLPLWQVTKKVLAGAGTLNRELGVRILLAAADYLQATCPRVLPSELERITVIRGLRSPVRVWLDGLRDRPGRRGLNEGLRRLERFRYEQWTNLLALSREEHAAARREHESLREDPDFLTWSRIETALEKATRVALTGAKDEVWKLAIQGCEQMFLDPELDCDLRAAVRREVGDWLLATPSVEPGG